MITSRLALQQFVKDTPFRIRKPSIAIKTRRYTAMSRAESPFDPFSVVDDDDEEEETTNSRANIKSTGSDSSNTSKTTNTRKSKQSKQSKQNIDPHLLQQDNRYNLASVQESTGTKPLPPKLRVRLTLHEEVSSMAVGDRGSMSQLSIEGKVTVSALQ